jgi:hypothetical protein
MSAITFRDSADESMHCQLAAPHGIDADTVALLNIVPLGPEFGGRNTGMLQRDLGCFPHK